MNCPVGYIALYNNIKMNNSLKNEIQVSVEKMYKQRVWISRIQETLVRNFNRDVPIELIREIIDEIKQWKQTIKETTEVIDDLQSKQLEKEDGWLQEIADSDNEPKKYDVSERHYIFYKWDKPYKVLISTVRAIYESYSKHWQNLSWEEIRQKFRLPAGIFELIKSATWLYKSSHIDDPVTLSRLSEDWLDEYIDGKVERVLEDKYITSYERAVNNKQRNDLAKMAISNRWYDIFMNKLEEAIKRYKPLEFDKIKVPEIKNNDTKDVFITDAHLWKKWTDWIVIRFKKLTNDLVNSPEKNINITFWWDLAELFIPYGEMHPAQRLWMEDIDTSDLIMLVVDVFEKMLVTIMKSGKNVTFNGMKWNHDRFTEKKDFDPNREPALIIYKFLQRILQETTIKVNILNDKANIIKSWKIKYIFIHWDWLSTAELNRRALAETEDGYYLVIVSWDKHSYKMQEISDKVLRIQAPAMAGAWQYDSSLALTSQPGAVEFKENNDGMVDFTVKRYK